MSVDRLTRVNELLRREIGTAIYRVFNNVDIDLAALTITHVMCSRDLRHARVLVSVRAEAHAQRRFLSLLAERRAEIQKEINRHVILKYTPRLAFRLDASVARGDRVLALISDLHIPDSPPDAEPEPGEEKYSHDER